jgi:hypothetical protein
MVIPKKDAIVEEKSVIQICLKRSNEITQLRKALVAVTSAKTEVSFCSKTFPSEDKLRELRNEIESCISQYQRNIANLLGPILSPHGIKLEDKYWFSSKDMTDGFVLFHKGLIIPQSGASHVLFLKDMEDTFDGNIIKEGEVHKYSYVNHFIDHLIEEDVKRVEKLKRKRISHTETSST